LVVQVAHKSREGVGNSSAAAIFSPFFFFFLSFFLCFSLPARTAVIPDSFIVSFFFLSPPTVRLRLVTTSASTEARKNIVTASSSVARPVPRPHGLATRKSQIPKSASL
jgi:hypothetical protein